ncbi:hypothetical protein TRFO_30242 [Tritrichomonas foetus]|uniref:F5/8 type C domain-containing protein n=1 Tax=Tritrichomonas foetus TaxID=1144522 RepID=A0A1J4JTX3_9EUKA|nr:hypothetical protein TRFO_30242 [Tritrichomonas foetus]|eukprot:OHT02577.1 hypothetical protein TRFO_30242 [Tritrichomonas foetus]
MENLTTIYFSSVGRGQPLLINFPPNTNGVLPDNFVQRVLEFGETINKTFEFDYAQQPGVKVTASSYRGDKIAKYSLQNERLKNEISFRPENVIDGSVDTYWTMDDEYTTGELTVDFGKFVELNIISIREHIPLGQRIMGYVVYVHTTNGWEKYGEAKSLGSRRLFRGELVSADKMKLVITESQAVPLIEEFGAFKGYGAFQ